MPVVIENRDKEFKCDLAMDWLSDHRFGASYFRLYLHATAMNLLVRRRRFIAEPLPALAPPPETPPSANWPNEAAPPVTGACVPAEALAGVERQRHFKKGPLLLSSSGPLSRPLALRPPDVFAAPCWPGFLANSLACRRQSRQPVNRPAGRVDRMPHPETNGSRPSFDKLFDNWLFDRNRQEGG
jgi:hypothetical protein